MTEGSMADGTSQDAGRTPGEVLAEARLNRGLDEEEIALRLNLSVDQIRAIESNRFGDLPGKTYVRGYLKGYARLVGCDEAEVFDNFHFHEDVPMRGLHPVFKESARGSKSLKIFALLVIVAIAGLSFAWWRSQQAPVVRPNEGGFLQQGAESIVQQTQEVDVLTETRTLTPAGSADEEVDGPAGGSSQAQPVEAAASAPLEDDLRARIAAEEAANAPDRTEPALGAAPAADAAGDGPGAAMDESTLQQGADRLVQEETAPESLEEGDAASEPQNVDRTAAGGPSAGYSPLAASSTPVPFENVKRVDLSFSDASWVDLRDADGQRLLYEHVNQGRSISLEGNPPFSVFLGNAEGVRIEYDGEPFDFSGHTHGVYARFTLGTSAR